jgi:hypothetical protein
MSKAEILLEIPKLEARDRREIFDHIRELEENDLPNEPAAEEKKLLDRELKTYQKNPVAGLTWDKVEARLRKSRA